MRYLARRLGHAGLLICGVTVLSFLFAEAAPGSVVDELRMDPRVSASTIATLRDRYGVGRPLPEKYVSWLSSVARGDFGYSVAYDGPVGPVIWPRVRNTLLLTIPATLLAWTIAIPAGVWTASRRGRLDDRVTAVATTALLSVPELLIGLGLLLFAMRTGYAPTGGMVSLDFEGLTAWAKVKDVASHFMIPVAALVLAIVPALVRHVRGSMIDVLNAPFVRAARAAGIPEGRILFRHALRAAANPLISLFGLSIAGLLSASLVVERIMSWPGLGPLLLDAVAARDLHLVVAAVVCSTVLLLGGGLVADALLYLADPRIRANQP